MPLLFLNEKSCGTDCDPLRADRAMTEFARTVVAVAREDRAGTVLVSEVELKHLQITDGYPIGKWIGAARNRDLWLRMRRTQDRAPFRAVLPGGEDPLDVEYRHEGVPVQGLGAAHLMDGLAVSLPVHARWDAAVLPLACEQLVEQPDGTPETQVSEVEVRHVSAERHLDEHRVWIRASCGTATARTGAQLWERRTELFPHVQFLPGVEGHLRGLKPVWVGPVRRRLTELEEAAAEWNPGTQASPLWRSVVNGEGEQRRLLCWFTDLDGERRLFDLHAKFTPDEGRVHFRLVSEDQAVRVAYVGRKRGI